MKKIIIVSTFLLAILTVPLCSSAVEYEKQIPDKNQQVSLSGGYIIYELTDREFYLLDSRNGRLWNLIGSMQQPTHFEPIKYEDSKGKLIVQPESDATKQFSGRFAFVEFPLKLSSNALIMLDTVTGNTWKLQGTPEAPIKMVLIPRKD